MRIDHVYVVSLRDRVFSRKRCVCQLRKHGITDYTLFDAVDGRLPCHDGLYAEIVATMDDDFCRHNFSRGALGCLLSHLEILRDAVAGKHKTILVLEDDFLFCHDFAARLQDVLEKLPARWDLVYLGKKQGRPDEPFHHHPRVHHDARFAEPAPIDDLFYRPSHRTWGSHALLLRETIFQAIFRAASEYFAPIDLVLISLYDRYACLAVRKDLVITDESESTVLQKPERAWDGWAVGDFACRQMWRPRRVFIVGENFHHTHTYIHEMYKKFIEYYYPHLEVTLSNGSDYLRHPGSIVFCSPAHFHEKILFRDTHLYIIHLDSDGDDRDFLEKYKKSQRLHAINYMVLLCREGITDLEYFDRDLSRRVLCLPWFCSRLCHEIAEPQDLRSRGWLLFFGSVWSINYNEILDLVRVVKKNGWRLVIKGRIFEISDDERRRFMGELDDSVRFERFVYKTGHEHENSLESVLERYPVRAMLPIQGSFHHTSYLSNRVFECLSHGFLILTNNAFVKRKFGSVVYETDLERLVLLHEELLLDRRRWLSVFDAQKKEYYEKFYGFVHIEHLFSFLQQATDDRFLVLDPEKQVRCDITFTRSSAAEPLTNETVRALLREPRDVVVGDNDLSRIDPFLLRRLAALAQYGGRVCVEPFCRQKAYIKNLFADTGTEVVAQNYLQFFRSRRTS